MGEMNILSGMLYCADCGKKMYLCRCTTTKQAEYFNCSSYRKQQKRTCTSHQITAHAAMELIKNDLKYTIKFANENKGTHVIARELREAGITPMRVKEWSNTVILRVIRNEKYCGDLVQKKTYTPDFLSHEKKYNRGEEEFVIIKDHHEPIVSRELFEKANRILDEKSLTQEGKAKHSNRYPFSGKIKCGCCGSSYVARYKTRKDGSKYKAWRCQEAAKHGSPHTDKAGNKIEITEPATKHGDATSPLHKAARTPIKPEIRLAAQIPAFAMKMPFISCTS